MLIDKIKYIIENLKNLKIVGSGTYDDFNQFILFQHQIHTHKLFLINLMPDEYLNVLLECNNGILSGNCKLKKKYSLDDENSLFADIYDDLLYLDHCTKFENYISFYIGKINQLFEHFYELSGKNVYNLNI